MRRLLLVSLVVLTAIAVGCSATAKADEPSATPTEMADPNSLTDPQAALDVARALWALHGADNYDMTFNWQCFCIVEYVVRVDLEVRDGAIEAGATEDGAVLPADRLAEYQTVTGLFALIQDAIDQDAAEIRTVYAGAGYPSEVWIDYSAQTADEERGFFIHELTVR
ncbi:MAG: DUF6174 domain-containing protein [Chloroflexi bacterium]|nr:DUF6174 domain-containing protein [Chloroflexota bacterium]MDA1145591.1 DUF6174 domain-containing protein [Chloroflexota bacterium]